MGEVSCGQPGNTSKTFFHGEPVCHETPICRLSAPLTAIQLLFDDHLHCLDKGYDNPTGRRVAAAQGYVAHIRRIGEENLDAKGQKRYPTRR